ncbi:hypothetical protein C1646_777303 [Rhizophagus diaphanus]|nr:hypothetical protein C1646_777303 [Rhizophagus diaphanus] [Rhizophagus sp. MUCL 43196]
MPKQKEYSVSLISAGELINNLHYGPYSRKWWLARPTSNNTTFCPIRLDIEDSIYNEFQPGYICQSEGLRSNVCENSSKAITSVYQKAFSNKTKHAGPLVMGFNIPHISEALLSDVHFRSFTFKIENLGVMVFSIGVSNNSDWNYAGEGYKSSFIHDFNHSQSLFFQVFDDDEAIVRIYKEFQKICNASAGWIIEFGFQAETSEFQRTKIHKSSGLPKNENHSFVRWASKERKPKVS